MYYFEVLQRGPKNRSYGDKREKEGANQKLDEVRKATKNRNIHVKRKRTYGYELSANRQPSNLEGSRLWKDQRGEGKRNENEQKLQREA